jgi:bifunctional ADP-heptose synthase (sugar kinase/adenylyltransferase)
MERNRLTSLFDLMPGLRVAVVGDFCLDAYWTLARTGEYSLETGREVHPVTSQRYELGGASNVVANLRALGVGCVVPVGLVGNDPFAWQLRRLLDAIEVPNETLIVQSAEWQTPVFCKPHLEGVEQDRFDLGGGNALSDESADRLVEAIRATADNDGVILNQQFPLTIWNEQTLSAARELADGSAPIVAVDSRDLPDQFGRSAIKLNAREAAALEGRSLAPGDAGRLDQARADAEALHGRTGRPVFLTRGKKPAIVVAESRIEQIEVIPIEGPIDPVGAGDTVIAAWVAGMAAGASPFEAARLAQLAAAVTVGKLQRTGTASPEEILNVSR